MSGFSNIATSNLPHCLKPVAASFTELVVSSTALPLFGTNGAYAAPVPASTLHVYVLCETASVRWTSDGTTPSTTAVPKATYTTATGVSNADLKYTAVANGTAGNSVTVAYVDPGAANQSLSVSVSGTAITVNLATNGGSAITSTGSLILAAIQASAAASALVTVALAPANTGAGVVIAIAATALSGATAGGFLLQPGGYLLLSQSEASTIQFVRATSSDAIIQAEQYKI